MPYTLTEWYVDAATVLLYFKLRQLGNVFPVPGNTMNTCKKLK